ncbi:MAG: multidrug efflux SMR transporter [Peptococcaceae bacterium]|nr:multidrug efflux SMR transporter [Peptococcaceae bacterium]
MQYYLYLAIAIVGELVGTTCLKYSAGFTKFFPTLLTIVAYTICFFFFSRALNGINLNIAYATWSALGIVVATLLSVFLFSEQITPMGILGTIILIIGVLILNLAGSPH